MPVFVDPNSGERFENVPEDEIERARSDFGLIPLAEFEAREAEAARPLADRALEQATAFGAAAARPVEAVSQAAVEMGVPDLLEAAGFPVLSGLTQGAAAVTEEHSPSSPEMQALAQKYPLTSAAGSVVPELHVTAGMGGVPAMAARVGAGTALGASEAAFQRGDEYGDVSAEDVAKLGALNVALEAVPFGLGKLAQAGRGILPAAREAAERLGKTVAGAQQKAGSLGKYATEAVLEEATETGLKGLGTVIGSAIGGAPGAIGGWALGRHLNKKFGDRIVQALGSAAQSSKPLSAESLAMGGGLGSIFGKVERALDRGGRAAGDVVGVGNVLARASRKAYEAMSYDDLELMSPAAQQDAIRENGARYAQEAHQQATDALEVQASATSKARIAAANRLFDMAPEPSLVQRQFAAEQLREIDRMTAAIRAAGKTEAADAIEERTEALIDAAAENDAESAVQHDAGAVLQSLAGAYELLSENRLHLGPDDSEALEALRIGTEKPELWGTAADMLRELRTAAEYADQVDISSQTDPASWRAALTQYADAMRFQVDALERWEIPTEEITESIDKLEQAIQRGDAVAASIMAARVGDNDAAGGVDAIDPNDPLKGLMSEVAAQAGVSEAEILDGLPDGMSRAIGDIQRKHHYERALRSIQYGAELSTRKAARAAVGLGPAPDRDPDEANARFEAGYSDEIAAFEARRSMLTRLQNDPEALSEAMSRSYGELAQTHPEVFSGLVSHTMRAIALLNENMPASIEVSLQNPGGIPPSIDDIRRYARGFMTVTEPETYLADLASGMAWPEQSQLFARAHPEKWAELSAEALVAAEQRGPSLTPQQATYLDLNFGVGNNLGGMWSDKGADAIRNANAARMKKAQEQAQKMGQRSVAPQFPQSATAALSGSPSQTPVT